ncbi:hypothetical protein [Microcoleus sp. D2_18a_D3]|uniref:hypothetical protein n=1 Tax=Microcoleus sp. D2_18a_D3 TaxID=3055330 RepID=UPI002FD3BA1F
MDNSGSAVRIDRSNEPPTQMVGKFCTANRIQKLIAPARELIQSSNTLKRLFDFFFRANQPKGREEARKLKPRFLEYWREACEFIKKEILARYKLFVQVNAGFQKLKLVERENLDTKVELPSKLKKEATGPPKGFVPLPDAEIGGCARNDSLIAPAI